jgi:hypothetical protein
MWSGGRDRWQVLVHDCDAVSGSDSPLDKHYAIKPGFSLVRLGNLAQYFRSSLPGVRIQRYHLAPWVTVSDRHDRFSAI